jgi:DNA-binding Lrp family transcriptional regulator
MDKLDYQIIDALQCDFLLNERPYEIIARRLSIHCERLWDRVEKLMAKGAIRRIGVSLGSHKCGFRDVLVAVSIKPALVEQATAIIGAFPEVTHSYLRDDQFNIWFTIIAADDERIQHVLEQVRSKLSPASSQILGLPVKHLFKLNARFNVSP